MNEKTIYALGFFDGVHLGHAALLKTCRAMAKAHGCRSGVVTFSSHPDALIHGAAPSLITTAQERDRLMRRYFSMDTVVTLPFDRDLMHMPWDAFYRMLRWEHGAAGFVCGEDFRFGAKGEGTGEKLRALCEAEGLACAVVPQVRLDGQVVSSTYIRGLLEKGWMESATKFLGHPYVLTGTVVRGHQLGRTLGVPTANLLLPEGIAVPKFGVYASRAVVDGKPYPAVTNIGTRPTVSGSGITVEPWILDFSGDLYGRQITLAFYRFLRAEMKFSDLEALQRQIRADARQTREYLGTVAQEGAGSL